MHYNIGEGENEDPRKEKQNRTAERMIRRERTEREELMKNTPRWIAVIAVGIALFVVLSLCLQVPVFENYYLCLGYVAMAVYCYSFGAVAGTLVGFLGVILYCVVINGMRGMPGWALGNIVIGVILGLTFRATKKMKNKLLRTVIDVAAIAVSTALGILVVKSETECLLYAQPFLVRVGKNIYAFVADLAAGRVRFVMGNPCQGAWRDIAL